jgi:hypothetical protein
VLGDVGGVLGGIAGRVDGPSVSAPKEMHHSSFFFARCPLDQAEVRLMFGATQKLRWDNPFPRTGCSLNCNFEYIPFSAKGKWLPAYIRMARRYITKKVRPRTLGSPAKWRYQKPRRTARPGVSGLCVLSSGIRTKLKPRHPYRAVCGARSRRTRPYCEGQGRYCRMVAVQGPLMKIQSKIGTSEMEILF